MNEFPAIWYDFANESHFWFQWRMRIFEKAVCALNLPKDKELTGLDIGCGNGTVRSQIEKATRWTVDGTDLDPKAIRMNPPLRGSVFDYDLRKRREVFREKYDFLILFDVLEHIKDVRLIVRSALFHLKPGGFLFINVPALQCLMSKYDEVQGHLMRYQKSVMRRLLRDGQIHIHLMQYWGLGMLPFVIARKFLVMKEKSVDAVIRKGFQPPSPLVHKLFKCIMGFETGVLKNPVLGTSLFVAGRKMR